jgi:hypothetical protein
MSGGTVVKNLTCNGGSGGVVIVTIAGTPADISPSSQACISCLVATKSGTCYMNIDTAVTPATEATATDWLLSTTPIPVPCVHNLNQLHFCGSAAALIQILWRN